MDIFKTPPRILMLSLVKKVDRPKTEQSKMESSLKISYPSQINVQSIQLTPGPGSYKLELKNRQRKYNFSGATRSSLIGKPISQLGPGSFNEPKVKTITIRIGTSKRPPLAMKTDSPGPGVYEYKPKIIETQGIKFKGSSYDYIEKERRKIPGPIYEPKIRDDAPKYSIGKSQRYDFTKEKRDVPGPHYEIIDRPSSPQYKFGTSKR